VSVIAWFQAELGQILLHFRASHPLEKLLRAGFVFRTLQHNGALLNRRVDSRDEYILTLRFELVRARQRKRDKTHLRISGFDELRRLHHVFADDELSLHFVGELQRAQRFVGRTAERRMKLIGDGNASDTRIGKQRHAQRDSQVAAGPQDKRAFCIRYGLLLCCQVCRDQLLWKHEIGPEKDVERRAVDDLCRQGSRASG
jgi:hypothetical protein